MSLSRHRGIPQPAGFIVPARAIEAQIYGRKASYFLLLLPSLSKKDIWGGGGCGGANDPATLGILLRPGAAGRHDLKATHRPFDQDQLSGFYESQFLHLQNGGEARSWGSPACEAITRQVLSYLADDLEAKRQVSVLFWGY